VYFATVLSVCFLVFCTRQQSMIHTEGTFAGYLGVVRKESHTIAWGGVCATDFLKTCWKLARLDVA
jgi:hypothetical protein